MLVILREHVHAMRAREREMATAQDSGGTDQVHAGVSLGSATI